ncbi:MAG: hypothetical protein KDD43_15735 [Bdellovibrionales bacterium]|nr:hypothetical protein [Bdellovibrionales bacterium]
MKKLVIALAMIASGFMATQAGSVAHAEGQERYRFCTELRGHIQQLAVYREHLKANLRVAFATQNAPAVQKLQQEIQRVSVIIRNMKIVFAEECS